jgi:pantetheine-phosphate adenylyltransferase
LTAAVFPGSFDPFTVGHLDLVTRAVALFDPVTVVLMRQADKPGWMPVEERRQAARAALVDAGLGQVAVVVWDGLLVDAMRDLRARVAVRGLRQSGDLAYEEAMAGANRTLWPAFEVVYLGSRPVLQHVSSSRVRELWRLGAPLDAFVPQAVLPFLPRRSEGGKDGGEGGHGL